ncbi:MAG: acyclic terpene utilization AtuA family protein [Pirellulales bacterium]
MSPRQTSVLVGNGAGFLGDQLEAPRRLVEAVRLDYLTLEYLAELTLSILARQREKDPAAGYAADFVEVLASLAPALTDQPGLRLITNAGGMNPPACAAAAASVLCAAGLPSARIGVVSGDDLLERLAELRQAGCRFEHLDTGQAFDFQLQTPVCANAYLGAQPIAEALAGDVRLVVTGRVADASLTLGPLVHEFGWAWDDWNRLAAGSVAGHLIECGAQVTGGYLSDWYGLDLAHVGYPIAEIAPDGTTVITKPKDTGGRVNRETVAAQLVYEIGDPAHYLTPDVDCDFTTVELAESGVDRVQVSGATGRQAPTHYKVSLAYRNGYMTSGQLLVAGADCVRRAHHCAEMVFARLRDAGWTFEETLVECLGAGDGVPGSPPHNPPEVTLRISVRDPRRTAVERFGRELAPLVTSGPAGLAGYVSARGPVRPVYAYWPTLVPRELAPPKVKVRTAAEWVERGKRSG